jgi:hypothetical protein
MGDWTGMRGGRRVLLVVVAALLLTTLLRVPLRSAGIGAIGVIMPFFMVVPWLILGWYRAQESKRPQCPTCELPLSYRKLGPSHGMLECPSLCGYRKLVGSPRPPS